MVPVALDERGEVLLPDLVKIRIERTGVGLRPLVAPFIHDHHAQLVAIVIKFRALRIMRRADGSASGSQQLLDGPLPHGIRHGGPGRNQRVMDAHALQLHRNAVDGETLSRRKLQLPDAERADVVIGRRRVVQNPGIGIVAHRRRRATRVCSWQATASARRCSVLFGLTVMGVATVFRALPSSS